jgi:predicted nucleic-acid-binding protein
LISVDTNVLVRVLTDDTGDTEQTSQARQLVALAGTVFVSQIVQVELVWVLQSAYGLGKQDILLVLDELLERPAYHLQLSLSFEAALERFRNSNAGFADSLIAVEGLKSGNALWTFDRKLSHQDGVRRLTAEALAGW